MPEVDTYTFRHKELLELLIKAADVHDGEWMLLVNFGFSAGNFGPDDDNMNPGSFSFINHIGITKAQNGSPRGLVIDAAKVNPRPT